MYEAPPQTWMPISQAFTIAIRHFGNRELANHQMLRAIKQGKIRNGGWLELRRGDLHYQQIHVHVDDFYKWLNSMVPGSIIRLN